MFRLGCNPPCISISWMMRVALSHAPLLSRHCQNLAVSQAIDCRLLSDRYCARTMPMPPPFAGLLWLDRFPATKLMPHASCHVPTPIGSPRPFAQRQTGVVLPPPRTLGNMQDDGRAT